MMEKLPMCRICLAENVRMHIVANRNLHEIYEKLTDIPFVTKDTRPMLACFFCCTKLKQCYQLLRQCLKAEAMYAQMINEDYKPNSGNNRNHLEVFSCLMKSPIEHISIVDECQAESIAIKEELPAVCEGLDDIMEPKLEHQSDELEPESFDNSYPDVADIPPQHSESDVDDIKSNFVETEVEEEQEVSQKNRGSGGTKRAPAAKKPKLDTRRTKLEDAITAQQTKTDKSDSKFIQTTQKRTSTPGPYFKEPYKCDQRSFNRDQTIVKHTRTQVGIKPYKCDVCESSFYCNSDLTRHIRVHTGEKPYKCDVCERSFSQKSDLTSHIRTHTGEKPFKCDVCQRTFSQQGYLTSHIRTHTGEKPFKCDVCERSFKQRGTLSSHIRIHTVGKPFKCDVCERSFSVKSSLTSHIRIHTGEEPYKCDICDRSFRHKGYLSMHIRRLHTSENAYKYDIYYSKHNRGHL